MSYLIYIYTVCTLSLYISIMIKLGFNIVLKICRRKFCRLLFGSERVNTDSASFHLIMLCQGNLGPVVQSIVSLTSSLRGQLVKCFMTL